MNFCNKIIISIVIVCSEIFRSFRTPSLNFIILKQRQMDGKPSRTYNKKKQLTKHIYPISLNSKIAIKARDTGRICFCHTHFLLIICPSRQSKENSI